MKPRTSKAETGHPGDQRADVSVAGFCILESRATLRAVRASEQCRAEQQARSLISTSSLPLGSEHALLHRSALSSPASFQGNNRPKLCFFSSKNRPFLIGDGTLDLPFEHISAVLGSDFRTLFSGICNVRCFWRYAGSELRSFLFGC